MNKPNLSIEMLATRIAINLNQGNYFRVQQIISNNTAEDLDLVNNRLDGNQRIMFEKLRVTAIMYN